MSLQPLLDKLSHNTTDELEDIILMLSTFRPSDKRDDMMDAACLLYSKRVSFRQFRETMILVNSCLVD